jgi:hypothetical protein
VTVPEYKEPSLGDESRHANEQYTLTRREGALPTAVVVIPDTQIMYNKADNSNQNVFDLYEVGSLRVGEASIPFVHRVELAGPKGEIVRFRSVFDDGALVNAIDEALYFTLIRKNTLSLRQSRDSLMFPGCLDHSQSLRDMPRRLTDTPKKTLESDKLYQPL